MENFKNFCTDLSLKKNSETFINHNRSIIKQELLKIIGKEITINNFERLINAKELHHMLDLYDKYFFDNKLQQYFKEHQCTLRVCYNDRCSKTGGMCKMRLGKCITIELSSKVFKAAFESDGIKSGGNITCNDILECMQLIFEHELVHAILFCFCSRMERSEDSEVPGIWSGRTGKGHNKLFMSVLNNLFGQTDYLHGLLRKTKNVDPVQVKKMIRLGSTIKFFSKDNKQITAIVTKKNPKKVKADEDGRIIRNWTVPYIGILSVDGISTNKDEITEVIPSPSKNNTSQGKSRTPSPKKPSPKKLSPKKPSPKKPSLNQLLVNLPLPPAPPTSPRTPSPKKPSPQKTNALSNSENNIFLLEKNKNNSKIKIKKKITIKKPTKLIIKPKTSLKPSVLQSKKIRAGKIDKNKKVHNSKHILEGECVFPFKYKRKEYNECLDTGNGPWCATKLKPSGIIDKWGYCINE